MTARACCCSRAGHRRRAAVLCAARHDGAAERHVSTTARPDVRALRAVLQRSVLSDRIARDDRHGAARHADHAARLVSGRLQLLARGPPRCDRCSSSAALAVLRQHRRQGVRLDAAAAHRFPQRLRRHCRGQRASIDAVHGAAAGERAGAHRARAARVGAGLRRARQPGVADGDRAAQHAGRRRRRHRGVQPVGGRLCRAGAGRRGLARPLPAGADVSADHDCAELGLRRRHWGDPAGHVDR